MEKYIKYVVTIVMILLIVFLVIRFNSNNNQDIVKNKETVNDEDYKWEKVPTVYVNGCLYGERGIVSKVIPDGWEYYGTILKNVPQHELTPEEDLSSNFAKVGTRVYVNKNNLHKIYVELIVDGIIQYNGFIDE